MAKIHMAGHPDHICGLALTSCTGHISAYFATPCPAIRPQHTGHVSALSLQSVGAQLDSLASIVRHSVQAWSLGYPYGCMLYPMHCDRPVARGRTTR